MKSLRKQMALAIYGTYMHNPDSTSSPHLATAVDATETVRIFLLSCGD